MKDQISIDRIKLLHPKVRNTFTAFVTDAENALGITLRVVQGLRTIEEQNGLYAQGRTAPGKKVTNAKGGSSYHNYGLAIDVAELKDGAINWKFEYEKLLPFAAKYGLGWGGHFKKIVDQPHFELTYGLNWRTLLDRYNKKDFIAGTKYVNI